MCYFQQKTADEMRISDWSSDVCSSDLLTGGTAEGSRLPWEEVRDWFPDAGNYVDSIDRAAETLAGQLRGKDPSPPIETIERRLRDALGISIVYSQTQALRDFDATMRHLVKIGRAHV